MAIFTAHSTSTSQRRNPSGSSLANKKHTWLAILVGILAVSTTSWAQTTTKKEDSSEGKVSAPQPNSPSNQATKRPAIGRIGDDFRVTTPRGSTLIPVNGSSVTTINHVAFRRNNTWVVWDERGLTIRTEKGVFNSRLPEITVSSKAFSADEIRTTVKEIAAGRRFKAASMLAGSLRVGTTVFLLPRWTDTDGQPWLEALYSVDLSSDNPRPKFVGRFEGFTRAFRPINDELFLVDGKPSAATANLETWGISSFSKEKSTFSHRILGSKLVRYFRDGLFIESSPYDTRILGRVNLAKGTRHTLAEINEPNFEILEGRTDIVTYQSKGRTILMNLLTGSSTSLKGLLNTTSVDGWVFAWLPGDESNFAALLDPERWTIRSSYAR